MILSCIDASLLSIYIGSNFLRFVGDISVSDSASIEYQLPTQDVTAFDGISLRVRGDGNRYQVSCVYVCVR